MQILDTLLDYFTKKFRKGDISKFHLIAFAILFFIVWVVIGCMAGGVLAFLTLFFSPENAWPSVIAFVGTVLLCSIYGLYLCIKMLKAIPKS